MKIKRLYTLLLSFVALVSFSSCYADSLLQVYEQAVHNDPVFKQAESTWYSAKENVPIARAEYLPNIDAQGTFSKDYNRTSPTRLATDGWNLTNTWSLTATQPIFDLPAWFNIQQAHATVKAATATYLGSIQDLMVRTSNAYFAVLQASDRLRYTVANKKAVYRQLMTAKQKFKVGLIAITGVYDAQSRYDQTVADEITDKNSLQNALENLRAITGQHYMSLKGIKYQVPLVTPKPKDINAWVKTADMQNYSLKAQNYTVIAARENIREQATGSMPVLDAIGSMGATTTTGYQTKGLPSTGSITGSLGLSMDFNVFQGGAVIANTAQARYDYLTQVGLLEQTHRTVVNQTRQAYLGIVSGISRVKADLQSIKSAKNALEATQAGYVVGTRTMVDVLNDLTTVYQAQNKFADDQYTYITNIIKLKQQAGTLGFKDLQEINSWFKATVKFDLPKSEYRPITDSTPIVQENVGKPRPIPANVHFRDLGKVPPSKSHHVSKPSAKQKASVVAQHNSQYTLQVYAARGLGEAKYYVYRMRKTLPGLRIVKHGMWYRVFYGKYSSRSAAQKALHNLPQAARKAKPWVVKTAQLKGASTPSMKPKSLALQTKPNVVAAKPQLANLPLPAAALPSPQLIKRLSVAQKPVHSVATYQPPKLDDAEHTVQEIQGLSAHHQLIPSPNHT